jgi:D-alanine-D-alanine ligase
MKILVLHSDIAPDAPPEEQDTLIAADAVASALAEKGYGVAKAAFRRDMLAGVLEMERPELVFNLVESVNGKGALATQAQRALRELGMAFTGTSGEAMDLTNDKPKTKQMLCDAGLATADWAEGPPWSALPAGKWIVKSALEDASLDLDDGCVVEAEAVPARAASSIARHGGRWFAEAFIDGREFNIAVLGPKGRPRIMPMAEMMFADWPDGKPRIVGYDAKWADESVASRHTVRRFGVETREPELAASIRGACAKVWDIFALCGFVRVDFRVDAKGVPLILEINANPGIAPDAGFAAAAAEAGMSYADLIEEIVKAAL